MASFTDLPVEILIMIGAYLTDFYSFRALWALTVTSRRNHHVFNDLLYQTHAGIHTTPYALQWGAISGQMRTLEWAVQNGADVNYSGTVGEPTDPQLHPGRLISARDIHEFHIQKPRSSTALHLAVMMGNDKVVE